MRIAVTYDNGEIFQHFGRTENFKIYDVEDGKVVSSEVISSNGSGHGALALVLEDHQVNVLICGGIGGGAQNALQQVGVEICAGASGNTDEAVVAYLAGELVDAGVTCDHHHGEEHTCGDHGCGHHDEEEAGGGCGGGCGGCGGGCGGEPTIIMEGKNAGKTVKVHYRGTLDDGTQFDCSYDRGEPLEFVCGAGMMIPGFDAAVLEMEVGQIVEVHLMPEEAYGPVNPGLILKLEIAQLPGSEDLNVGEKAYLSNAMGQPFPVNVTAKDDTYITFDANHDLAGKALNFKIELLEIAD